jgi:TRAP-type C4-dicarboxylate transport system permease large subunit
VLVIAQGTGSMLHSRLLDLGERLFPDYSELRTDPEEPTCDPETVGRTLPETAPAEEDEASGAGDDDFLDGLIEEPDSGPSEAAIQAAREQCLQAHADYTDRVDRITGGVRVFRGVERAVNFIVGWGDSHTPHVLWVLILVCGVVATGLRAHIALRPIVTVRDDRVSQLGQLAANLALLYTAFAKYRVDQTTGLDIQFASLPILWMIGFGAMAAMNVRHLLKPPADAERGAGVGGALLAIPLYAAMALIAGIYFFGVERHPSGPAIYLHKLTENAKLYVQVGLYVWTGMLLKRTRIARLAFDVLRPWKLSPELLAPIVVAAAAIPTAYSGASGIFVIAAGAVIYDELRRAGARRQLAVAATAMSGSLGVVLSPCLLVVVVAYLNDKVTTTELYHWGWRVYGLSATIFLVACILTRRQPLTIAPPLEGLRGSLKALKPLVPYALISAAILAFYALALGTRLNEHTAPIMLPIILLVLLIYDRWSAKRAHRKRLSGPSEDESSESSEPGNSGEAAEPTAPTGFWRSALRATDETTAHSGALLMLMGLSMGLGGVIERSEVMLLVPQHLGSVWVAMALLVLVLVFIGMIMDPYGAVILVSVTIAPVAYMNGINPLHFWMTVLAAFELGYLTPPVALNQLLTRQVIRVEPEDAGAEGTLNTYWRRHESLLLPLAVMALRLLIVGFGPIFLY